jgi:nicotinate-nucleotide adenylyltransferase
VALARCAVDQLQLDVLHIFPTGQAWHKARVASAAEHRLAMAELAFGGIDHVQVDDREIRRQGPTYTVDTLDALKAENPGAAFFLVLGADQAEAFASWHRWQAIVANATICIAARDQSTGTSGIFGSHSGLEARIETLRLPSIPLSATEIRHRVASRLGVAHLVPEAVARYIDNHQLYQTT